MYQTPKKLFLSPNQSQSEISRSKQRHLTVQGSLNIGDHAIIPRKDNQYKNVPKDDRIIPMRCFDHIKLNRGRLIDWILYIFSFYRLGWEGYWICIELIDQLITDYNYINLDNINIVGVTCIFISSKYTNVSSLKLNQIIASRIGDNNFQRSEILQEEQKIFQIIFKHSKIQRQTIYHYLIQLNLNENKQIICQALRWMTIIWTRASDVLIYLRVRTYKQLANRVAYNLSQKNKEYLNHILQENELEWNAYALRKYANQLQL